MYSITELRKDTLIELEAVPYKVIEYSHTKMGRGGATVRIKIKSLIDGTVLEKAFKNDEKIAPADVSRQPMQYLYHDETMAHFMSLETYANYLANLSISQEVIDFIPEGETVDVILFNDQIIGFELPKNVNLTVEYAESAVKGDTSSNALKTVKVQTGIEVRVPLFIKKDDIIKVDTRDYKYIERIS